MQAEGAGKNYVIAFASRVLTPAEKNYSMRSQWTTIILSLSSGTYGCVWEEEIKFSLAWIF